MSPAERAHAATIRFTKRRDEYLTRRWASKHAVAAFAGWEPTWERLASIEIRNHPSGAPWVAVGGSPAPIEVSLTDRAGWAVCLCAEPVTMAEVGVDLELVEPRSDAFVNDFLVPAEQDFVRSHPTERDRHLAANLMWSAKEAALKVLRVGLRADTRTVVVDATARPRADGWAELSVTSDDGERFPGWWRVDGDFVLTMCARLETDPPALLPGSADLTSAMPTHTWMDKPLA